MPWCPCKQYRHIEGRLCDDDGMVRKGVMHHGTDYACTGHAHLAGDHIRCTSPAHAAGRTSSTPPTIGRVVLYRTDGRNGLVYDLPAIVTCTRASHPGDYPTGLRNPLPVPEDEEHLHLTVFTPGGFGTQVVSAEDHQPGDIALPSTAFIGAQSLRPGSGTYVEWNVPPAADPDDPSPRSWRWPPRAS